MIFRSKFRSSSWKAKRCEKKSHFSEVTKFRGRGGGARRLPGEKYKEGYEDLCDNNLAYPFDAGQEIEVFDHACWSRTPLPLRGRRIENPLGGTTAAHPLLESLARCCKTIEKWIRGRLPVARHDLSKFLYFLASKRCRTWSRSCHRTARSWSSKSIPVFLRKSRRNLPWTLPNRAPGPPKSSPGDSKIEVGALQEAIFKRPST